MHVKKLVGQGVAIDICPPNRYSLLGNAASSIHSTTRRTFVCQRNSTVVAQAYGNLFVAQRRGTGIDRFKGMLSNITQVVVSMG